RAVVVGRHLRLGRRILASTGQSCGRTDTEDCQKHRDTLHWSSSVLFQLSVARSSGGILKVAAAVFSSKCAIEAVPGIGSMTGERASNHASATCAGGSPSRRASPFRPRDLSAAPSPSGYHGMKATPSRSQALSTSRSEEHTSELQSRGHLVCRLLL